MMLKRSMVILAVLYLFFCLAMANAESLSEKFQYLHPLPGSELVSPQTTIIMRTGDYVTTGDIIGYKQVKIDGSASGDHGFDLIISDDDRTAILKPFSEFEPGEVVTVGITDGGSFAFTISPKTHPLLNEQDWDEIYDEFYYDEPYPVKSDDDLITDVDPAFPLDFPPIDVPINTSPAPGYVFLSNHGLDYGTTPYLMILENDGTPVYFKKMQRLINDFKLSRNDLITYCEFARGFTFDNVFYAMDQTYSVVDSFRMGNGYITDQHGFKLLDNYHTLMLAYDPQTYDMSDSVEGGDTAATVIGLIVQELDSLKNVIFEWRSWDHFSIMDSPFINYTSSRIDYVHGNAIDLDLDGNIIISSRSLNEITKIDRTTGDIIWRLGLNALNNEFTFVADTAGYYAQHHCRILSDGHLTCFDNGNYHTPQYSRAVEYELDQTNMICTLVWEYRNNPDIFGGNRGGVQRLANDNTMIGWGGGAGVTASEVQMDGTKVYEINIGDPVVQVSYRAYRFNWTGIAGTTYLIAEQDSAGIHLVFYKFGDPSITDYIIYMDSLPNPTSPLDTTAYNYYSLTDLPNGKTYYVRVSGVDYSGIEGPYSNEVEITMPNLYMPGDANSDDQVIGSDVTFLVNYFRAMATPPDSCWNPDTQSFLYSAADANGDCQVIGSDVTLIVNYFRALADIRFCPATPPFGYEE